MSYDAELTILFVIVLVNAAVGVMMMKVHSLLFTVDDGLLMFSWVKFRNDPQRSTSP